MPRVRVLALPLALLLVAAPRAAGAVGLAIAWSAPGDCGTQAELEAGVEHIVGQPLSALSSSWSEVKVTIEQASPGSYRLLVLVVASSGARRERSVVTGTCREAAEAAQVIVATSLGGSAPAENTEPAPSAEPSEPAPTPPEPAAASPAPTPSAPAPIAPAARALAPALRFSAGARLGLEANLLPRATELGALALGIGTESFALELSVASTLRVHDPVPPGTVGLLLQRAALEACARFTNGSFALEPCAGVELGRLLAEGKDLPAARTQTGFWSAALAGGRVAWRVKPSFSWVGGLQVAVPLRRLEIALEPGQRVFLTPPVGFRPFLGIEVGFR